MWDFSKKYNHIVVEKEILEKYNKKKIFSYKWPKTKKDQENCIRVSSIPFAISENLNKANAQDLIMFDVLKKFFLMNWKIIEDGCCVYSQNKIIENEELSKRKISNLLQLYNKWRGDGLKDMNQLWLSLDFNNEQKLFSKNDGYKIRELFVNLANRWCFYEDQAISYRSIQEKRVLSPDEIESKKIKWKKYNIRYYVDTKNISVVVATTSPETIFADVALAVNPNDKRYRKLVWVKVIIPIVNKVIPIIADENIDMTIDNGIIRITPWHDKLWLMIAQKHKLKLNRFAIDENWNFTKIASHLVGKRVVDFFDNIIQNLDDIHNLQSVQEWEYDIPVYKKTWEKLLALLSQQWFLRCVKGFDKLNYIISNWKQDFYPSKMVDEIKDWLNGIKHRLISKQYLWWYKLPIWKSEKWNTYFIDDEFIINLPKKKTKNKKIILSLIIFNLISDGYLPIYFTLDELLDLLFSADIQPNKTVIQANLDNYKNKKFKSYWQDIKELQKIIDYSTKEKWISNYEKFSSFFIKLLEKCFAISSRNNGKFNFDFDLLVDDEWVEQESAKIDSWLINSLFTLSDLGLFDKQNNIGKNIIITCHDNIQDVLKISLLSLEILDKLPFDVMYLWEYERKAFYAFEKELATKILIRNFGSDCLRLSLILNIHHNQGFKDFLKYNYEFINKLWNASRYVFVNLMNWRVPPKWLNIETLEKRISKNTDKLDIFDVWIINQIKDLYQDIDDFVFSNKLTEFADKLINLIKNDFCDKYLEIRKINKSEYGNDIMLFCLGQLLKFLYPYAPFITEKIRSLLGFEWFLLHQRLMPFFQTLTKNYKTQLFVDILDRFLYMKQKNDYKKHQLIDVFFKATPDFLQHLRKNENIIKKLVNIENVEYFDNDRKLPKYETETIIDVVIWMKAVLKVDKLDELSVLQKELENDKEYLQHLRWLMSSLSVGGLQEDAMDQKKKEIAKTKKNIERLEYEISKMKSKH